MILIVVCVLFFAGRWFYHDGGWLQRLPTSLLLELQGDHDSPTTLELWRRLKAGTLSQTEADAMLRAAICDEHFEARSPYPAHAGIRCYVKILSELPRANTEGWFLTPTTFQFTVDGQVVQPLTICNLGLGHRLSLDTPGVRGWADISGLAPGAHELALVATIEVIPDDTVRPSPPITPALNLRLSQRVQVEPFPVASFAKAISTDSLDSAMLATVSARVGRVGRPGGLYVNIHVNRAPVNVAAEAFIRLRGETRFTPLIRFSAMAGTDRMQAYPLETGADVKTCDLRLAPSAEEALAVGFTEYYGSVIEWIGIPISDDPRDRALGPSSHWVRPTTTSKPATSLAAP